MVFVRPAWVLNKQKVLLLWVVVMPSKTTGRKPGKVVFVMVRSALYAVYVGKLPAEGVNLQSTNCTARAL